MLRDFGARRGRGSRVTVATAASPRVDLSRSRDAYVCRGSALRSVRDEAGKKHTSTTVNRIERYGEAKARILSFRDRYLVRDICISYMFTCKIYASE